MSDQQLAATTNKPSALAVMAARFSLEPSKLLSTLKATVFKGASDDEMCALVVVANEYGLNPLTKEIYAFPAKGGGIVPVVSIDGWINRMNSHPQFDGIEFADSFDAAGKPVSVTASIFRKDRTRPTIVTEYYGECYRSSDPWNKCPARMLRHKALMQCVRVAFGFAGVHDEDDAAAITSSVTISEIPRAQLTDTRAVEAEVIPPDKRPDPRPKAEKPKAKPEPAPEKTPALASDPAPAPETPHGKLRAMLAEGGWTDDECVKLAISVFPALKHIKTVDEIPASRIADIIEDWATAEGAMKTIRG